MKPFQAPSPRKAMSLGAAITVVSLLPVFLTSALVVQMTEDLVFGTVGLGALVALNRAFAAATSPWIGRLTDQLGAIRAMRIGGMVAIVCSLGVALATTNWWALAFWVTLAGGANVFAQTAANRLLSNNVPANRLGTAFGMKQSAPP
ncbi:MAG: MFS transporter, partial [Nitriliruptoraceae bacterium]